VNPLRVVILVLSDRCARGESEDGSGSALRDWLAARQVTVGGLEILPDEREVIARFLQDACDGDAWDLVLTCGGTGVAPRDVTPEATREVIDRELPGFGEAMRRAGAQVSPHAAISRALAGVRSGVLIVNLPGSPRAAVESLEAVWPAVPHAVAKIQGDPADCGAPGGT
jgi:molybdenum cofactor synthesis domain-containing protein